MENFSRLFPVFLLVLLAGYDSQAFPSKCADSFSRDLMVSSSELGFSQNMIGIGWGRAKLQKITVLFDSWIKKRGLSYKNVTNDLRKEFIFEVLTKEEPFLIYVDTAGQRRILDNHHDFWALTRFMHNEPNANTAPFLVRGILKMDYRGTNPDTKLPWTKSEMVADLVAKERIILKDVEVPAVEDFDQIPKYIDGLIDSPMRSYVSVALASIEIPYKTESGNIRKTSFKGSDFVPMIQFLIERQMVKLNLAPDINRLTESESIDIIKENILNQTTLLEFLLEKIRPQLKRTRKRRLRRFLQNRISELED